MIFGVVGYAKVKVGMPLPPGLSLGDQTELNLIRASMTDKDPRLVFTRPISRGSCWLWHFPWSWRSGNTGATRSARSVRTDFQSEVD